MNTKTASTRSAHASKAQNEGVNPNSFLGRQSILDRERNLFAYELLFRSNHQDNFFVENDGDHASRKTMDNALNVMGLQSLTAGRMAFINITRQLLMDETYTVLPPNAAVIELLENVVPDAEVVAACRKLKDHGYLLALDDFVFAPGYESLIEIADFIKIQFLGISSEERRRITDTLSNRNVSLLAEKIETHADHAEALSLGYSYFQGYFFCKPEIVAGREIPAFKQNYIRFLQQINLPHLQFDKLEEIVKQEVSLSVKLLRYLNSANTGLRVKVESIKHALALLGEEPLKRWGSLVAMTQLGGDKPTELVTLSLIRARFCESLAPLTEFRNRGLDLFLLGLLSSADALTDSPMSAIIGDMVLAHDVKAALMGGGTLMASVLGLALSCERGNQRLAAALASKLILPEDKVCTLYRYAMMWADRVLHS